MRPSFVTDGHEKIEMYALRVKSPEPPMPFIILVPSTWVEFTHPKMSASRAVFMAITPSRLMTSGLFDISAGRMRILSWKKSRSANSCDSTSLEKVIEHVLANLHFPVRSSSRTESCTTSVYIMKLGNSLSMHR